MSVRWARKLILSLVALLVLYALIGWLVVPRILQSKAVQYVSEKTGYRLALDLPKFNPFTFDIDIPNIRLDDPAGKRLMAIAELDANLAVLRRGLAFDSVRLEAPQADIVLGKNGKSNWSEFLEKISGGGAQSGTPTRLYLARFDLQGGMIDFRDESKGFHERIEPIQLNLKDVSTSPGETGSFGLSARTDSGISLSWQGMTDFSKASGKLVLDNLDSRPIAAYLKGIPAFEKGMLSADIRISYAEGKVGLNLDGVQMKVERIRLKPLLFIEAVEAKGGSFDLGKEKLAFARISASKSRVGKYAEIGTLGLDDMRADLSGRSVSAGKIAIEKGSLKLVRGKDGRLDILGAMKSSGKSDASPWHYHVGKFDLSGFSATFQDESVSPYATLKLKRISFKANGIGDAPAISVPFQASMESATGGMLEAHGRFMPSGKSADMNLKIRDLSLIPAQPYLSTITVLTIADGKLGASGHAAYDGKGARYAGSFSIDDLRLMNKQRVFLSWKSISTRNLKADRSKLAIATLDVDRPYAKLAIARNRTVNLAKVLKKREAASGSGFPVDIGRISIRRGEMDYADRSLALPFGTRIHRLHGFVNGISTSPGSIGQLQLRGQVDTYGSFRAAGQVNLFDPTVLTDIKVKFRNIEMARLTPYSATFVGRKITSGKLSLDLDYKIKNRQLTGDNQIIMDNLTLGERVKSREAKDLPLDLAIAVLQDQDGRIDLGLPVSGSLDNPQFSYGGIIWEAFLKVVGKIVTSPFRMLSALFGGTEDRLANIAFDPGSAALPPPEQEKIANLAGALKKRPGLFLTVHGVYSDSDRVALQDLQARRAVAAALGQDAAHPGPLALSFPGTREAIAALFSKKFGSAELDAMKAGFRKANPGKMKAGLTERMTGFFRKKRVLDEKEVAALKGADFHAVLYKKLRDAQVVPESELNALGNVRGKLIYSALSASGAPVDRIRLASPVHVEGMGEEVPVKLELAPAVK